MNAIPFTTPIDGPGMVPDGSQAQLIGLALLVLLFIGFAVMLWMAGHADQKRARLHCPVHLQQARVTFRVAPDGTRTDVVRCSLFRGRPAITCGKPCLRQAAAG